jgi:chromosomal replication initiator protein
VPVATLISQLPEGGVTLELTGRVTWCNGFVAGPENALLVRVLDDLCGRGSPYNPLVLYGPSGIGKSLLAHGLAQRWATGSPADRVVLTTGADYASGYAAAIESRSVPAWRETHRTADFLVLDDLTQLVTKAAAQIELQHTIDALLLEGRQIVVTARTTPRKISQLIPSLVSRLAAGLTLGVMPPAASARLAILGDIIRKRGLSIEDDAVCLLADQLMVSVPELSGALYDLQANLGSTEPISRAEVARYLEKRPACRGATLREIATHTARHFALQVADLRSPSRRQQVVRARAVAMYVARQVTDKSLDAVGQYFGGRDHTTVLHGCRTIEGLLAHDAELRQAVYELRATLDR